MGVPPGALGLWTVGVHAAQMAVEAQTVMTLRLLGLAGAWTAVPAEAARMLLEKPDAVIRSASSATEAMIAGKRPDQIAEAAMRPLRSGPARLSREGLKRRKTGKGGS